MEEMDGKTWRERENVKKKRENGWKNSLTKWPLSRQMVGEERCEAEEQENAPHPIFFTKTEMHTWYSSGQMTLIQPDELLPFQNLQNNNGGHLCAKLSRLIPAFENVQNTHFSWLNIFARLPCPSSYSLWLKIVISWLDVAAVSHTSLGCRCECLTALSVRATCMKNNCRGNPAANRSWLVKIDDLRRSGPHDEWCDCDVTYWFGNTCRQAERLVSRSAPFLVSFSFLSRRFHIWMCGWYQVLGSDWSLSVVWASAPVHVPTCFRYAGTDAGGDLNNPTLWWQLSAWKQTRVQQWGIEFCENNWRWLIGESTDTPLKRLSVKGLIHWMLWQILQKRIQSISQTYCSQAAIQTHKSSCEEFGLKVSICKYISALHISTWVLV